MTTNTTTEPDAPIPWPCNLTEEEESALTDDERGDYDAAHSDAVLRDEGIDIRVDTYSDWLAKRDPVIQSKLAALRHRLERMTYEELIAEEDNPPELID